MTVLKRNYKFEKFDKEKIMYSISRSAFDVGVILTDELKEGVANYVEKKLNDRGQSFYATSFVRITVEKALEMYDKRILESYKNFNKS